MDRRRANCRFPGKPGRDKINGSMEMAKQNSSPGDSPEAFGRVTKVVRNASGQLEVHVEGRNEPIKDARVARCFPWSLRDCYICLRTHEGKEIAMLRSLEDMDPDSRAVVEADLADRVFYPTILRILDRKSEFGIVSLTAQTDRGTVTFQVRSRDDVRLLSSARALFRDADGNTYELSDVTKLDPASRKAFQQYF